MAVRSAELGHAVVAAGATTTLGTVPSGKTWIIKYLTVDKAGAGAQTTLLYVTRSGVDYGLDRFSFATAAGSHSLSMFNVLEPGDILKLNNAGALTSVTVWVSGAELAGVA